MIFSCGLVEGGNFTKILARLRDAAHRLSRTGDRPKEKGRQTAAAFEHQL
jgi:hypothetical protein